MIAKFELDDTNVCSRFVRVPIQNTAYWIVNYANNISKENNW